MSESPEPSEEIVEWLFSLRLSQYTSCLQEGGFDSLDACKDLTDERLLQLKVFPTGHRRRILRSLEALGVKQSAGEDDEEGGTEDGTQQRPPVPHPRHIFKNKLRGLSYQHHKPHLGKDTRGLEGSQTLPPGARLGTRVKDDPESRRVRPPLPAPRHPQNIQNSWILASVSSGSSSSESLSISEMPLDWEISEDPTLSGTDSTACPAEAPQAAPVEDNKVFSGEMVENAIYESSFTTGPRLTRSYRLRHRPVPEIPNQAVPPLNDRYGTLQVCRRQFTEVKTETKQSELAFRLKRLTHLPKMGNGLLKVT